MVKLAMTKAVTMNPEYVAEVIKLGTVKDGYIHIEQDRLKELDAIRLRYGRKGLGDVVEKIARPIAKALRMPCHDVAGRLKSESPCAKRKANLNGL